MALGGTLGLGITLTAADLASSTIKSVAKSLAGLDDGVAKFAKDIAKNLGVAEKSATMALTGMAKGLSIAALGVAALGGAFKLADSGQFEYQLAEIAQTTKATTEQVEALKKEALLLGSQGRAAPKEVAEAFRELASSSLDSELALRALRPTMDLVAASFGRLSPQQAGGLMAKTLEAFPELAGNATLAADTLARAVKGSGLKFDELEQAMKGAVKGAGLFGGSLVDTLAALGAIKERVPNLSMGMRGITSAMAKLANPEAQKHLGAFVNVVDQATGKFRPFLDVISDLAQQLQGMGEGERLQFLEKAFGPQAAGTVSELMQSITQEALKAGHGVADFGKALVTMRGRMTDATVSAKMMADAQFATWDGTKKAILSALDAIQEEIGDTFLQLLRPVLIVVRDAVLAVASAFHEMPEGLKKALAGFAIFGSVALVVGGVASALATLAVTIGPEVLVAAVAAAAGAVFTLGQVLVPAAAAIYTLYKVWTTNFGGIRDVVLPIVDKISLAVHSLYALFSRGEISGALADDLTKAENTGVFKFVEAVSEAVATVMAFFRGLWRGLEPGVQRVGQIFGATFKAIGSAFTSVFSAIGHVYNAFAKLFGMGTSAQIEGVEDVGAIIGRVLGGVAEAIAYVAQAIAYGIAGVAGFIDLAADLFESIATEISDTFDVAAYTIGVVIDGIVAGFRGAVNVVIGIVNEIISQVAKIPYIGEKVAGLKLDELKAPETTQAGAPSAGPGGGGSSWGSPTATTAGVSPSVATTSMPSSAPPAGGGPSANDLQAAITAALASRPDPFKDRPIVVQNEVTLDGRKLAAANAQTSRDRTSGGGRIQPWK